MDNRAANGAIDSKEYDPRPFAVTHRLVLSIAVPMMLGFVTTPLVGLASTAIVGHMGGAERLAGVAVGAVLFDLLFSGFDFLRAATIGLTAQAVGRGDHRGRQTVFWRAFLCALACGVLMMVASPLLLMAGIWVMAPEPAVAEVTRTYVTIRLFCAPLTFINYVLFAFALGSGRARLALLLEILLNGGNVVFALLFGIALGWGVAGIAWATLVGEALAAIVGFCVIYHGFERRERPSLAQITEKAALVRLMALNRDFLVRTFVLVGAYALMTRIGGQFGALTLGANAVLMNFTMLSSFFLDGFASAAEQLTGRAIGARYRPAFDRGLRLTGLWSGALAIVVGALIMVFGGDLIALLTVDETVRAAAALYLPWTALTAMTGVLAFLLDGVFSGGTWSKDIRDHMLAAFAVYCAALACLVPFFGNHGLWAAFNLFLLTRGLFLLARLPRRAAQSFAPAQ